MYFIGFHGASLFCSKQMLGPHHNQLRFSMLWLPLASVSLQPIILWLSSVLARFDFCFLNTPKLSPLWELFWLIYLWCARLPYLAMAFRLASSLWSNSILQSLLTTPYLKCDYEVVNWLELPYLISWAKALTIWGLITYNTEIVPLGKWLW